MDVALKQLNFTFQEEDISKEIVKEGRVVIHYAVSNVTLSNKLKLVASHFVWNITDQINLFI